MRILLTPVKRFYRINKRNFSLRCAAAFVGGPIFLHYPAIALPVCWCSCIQLRKHQREEVDSSYFIIKRGFFCRKRAL